jgi:hypothetical protein
MKKIILTCVLSLGLMCSAFAATSSFFTDDGGACDVKKECAAKDAKGCPVEGCSFSSSGGVLYVVCVYSHCDLLLD